MLVEIVSKKYFSKSLSGKLRTTGRVMGPWNIIVENVGSWIQKV